MMRKTARWAAVAALCSLSTLGAACSSTGSGDGSRGNGESGGSGLTGSVVVSGSSTVQPISSLVAEKFSTANPDVQISVDGPGTGDGFALFCDGKIDVSDASRPIEDSEASTCSKNGIAYVELKIGLDGITVMTNPSNDVVACLTKVDLYSLFGPESQGFTTWADANGLDKALGGGGTFPDAPLDITAPGEESGTYDAFIELVGIEATALSDGVSAAQAASLRPDYQSSPDDTVIIQAMEGSPSALGFVGFAYAQGAGDKIKELQVDGGDGCTAPTFDTIANGSYPLSRSLYVYVNTEKASQNPALKAFIDLYMSSDGLASVDEAGYVNLPDSDISATRSAWSSAEG
jgi:phosphate transport system substrate-binding protein